MCSATRCLLRLLPVPYHGSDIDRDDVTRANYPMLQCCYALLELVCAAHVARCMKEYSGCLLVKVVRNGDFNVAYVARCVCGYSGCSLGKLQKLLI